MTRPSGPLEHALATLRGRWGSAAIRLGSGEGGALSTQGGRFPAAQGGSVGGARLGPFPETHGALALAVLPDPDPVLAALPDRPAEHGAALVSLPGLAERPTPTPSSGVAAGHRPDIVSTGFPALDAILGPAGLPLEASAAIRGDLSSGKTTVALRCVAEAQAAGSIVAWLDPGRAFDPHEAVGRGVDLRWLLVVRPAGLVEGFRLAGALLSGRSVDLLVVDLPAGLPHSMEGFVRRLAAHARRTRARLLILEPTSLGASLRAAVGETSGLRLELERRAWLRLGRDVVGQRTEVTVSRNRYGPPGRRASLEIHYLSDGERAVAAHRLALHHLAAGATAAAAEGAWGGLPSAPDARRAMRAGTRA